MIELGGQIALRSKGESLSLKFNKKGKLARGKEESGVDERKDVIKGIQPSCHPQGGS